MAVRRFRERPQSAPGLGRQAGPLRSEWRPFALLVVLYCVAAGVTTGLLVYVPLFLVHARSTSPAAASVMTSVLLGAAAAGTLLGGIAAQRLGRRFVLIVPQLLLVPAIALLPSLSYAAMIPVVVLIGIAMNANVSTALVLAQEYLPARMGLATGLTIGLCSGVGGLIVAALGLLGDAAGLEPRALRARRAAARGRGARPLAAAAGGRSRGHGLESAGRSRALIERRRGRLAEEAGLGKRVPVRQDSTWRRP